MGLLRQVRFLHIALARGEHCLHGVNQHGQLNTAASAEIVSSSRRGQARGSSKKQCVPRCLYYHCKAPAHSPPTQPSSSALAGTVKRDGSRFQLVLYVQILS